MLKAALIAAVVNLAGLAQAPTILALTKETPDPFIATIAAMKHSVAPVVCVEVKEGNARFLEVEGSALFISQGGEFVTAAHVLQWMASNPSACPTTAIFLPATGWQPEKPDEVLFWFPFNVQDCAIDAPVDVAKCKPVHDLSDHQKGASFRIRPARFEYAAQPDGTQVAFTGFPLSNRDPMTSRAGIATHRNIVVDGELISELILDHVAWPGGSGSPVYLADGRVIGILLARGIQEATGVAVVRPSASLRQILGER